MSSSFLLKYIGFGIRVAGRCLSAILLFQLWSCTTEETTVIQPQFDRSLDPSLTPAVEYTYPSSNAVGPFPLFTPSFYGCYLECFNCDCIRPPHFTVQFNKVMLTKSFTDSTVQVIGFDHPVHVRLLSTSHGTDRVVDFRLTEDTPYETEAPYQVGKTYTVIIGTGVTDVSGNHPGSPYEFSFTPEPFFRIIRSDPAAGDTVSPYAGMHLQFNSRVDTSLASAFLFTPPVEGYWQGYGGADLYFNPGAGFQSGREYTFRMAAGVRDYAGDATGQDVAISFHTVGFSVNGTMPVGGGTLSGVDGVPWIGFTARVSGNGLDSLVSIEPPGNFKLYGDWTRIEIVPQLHDFIPDTTYHIRVSANLLSVAGDRLGTPYTFSFATPSFKVGSVYPRGQDVSRSSTLRFSFTGRIDTATVRSAFSMTPAAPGHLTFDRFNANSFSFVPDSIYRPATKYTATVGKTLRSIDGVAIRKKFTLTFTTVQ